MRIGLDLLQIKDHLNRDFPAFDENGIRVRMLDDYDSSEFKEYLKFRYDHWVKRLKYASGSQGNENFEYDKYDDHSIHFGAFDAKNRIVGCSRIILPVKHGLQAPDIFEDKIHPRVLRQAPVNQSIEASRLTVADDLGKKRRHVARMFYKVQYQFTKKFGFKFWYLVGEERFIRALRLLERFPFEIIGGGLQYMGSTRYPAVMEIEKAVNLLLKERPEFMHWLSEGIENIETVACFTLEDEELIDVGLL